VEAAIEDYLVMPRLRALAQAMARTLALGRSVIAETGAFIDPEWWMSRVAEQPELLDCVPIIVTADATVSPEDSLSTVMGVRADRLLVDPTVTCDGWQLILVHGLDQLAVTAATRWVQWVTRWARASHSRRTSGEPLPPLCICWRNRAATIELPSADTALDTYSVFRAASELDVRMLVRHRGGAAHDGAQRWREHVLPPLVGNDLALVTALWEPCLRDLTALTNALQDHARNRGWPRQAPVARIAAPTRVDELAGLACSTPERGSEWHLAWAVSRGDTMSFTRRLWRGQAGFLLPILDEIRFKLADRLNEVLGRDWATRWPPRDEDEQRLVRTSHLHAQFGHMLAVLQQRPPAVGRKVRANLEELASAARLVRNALAHYRPVDYSTYRDLMARVSDAGLELH